MEIKTITAGYLGNNVYVVWDETKECAIIDAGVGMARVVETIEQNALTPKCILLTHGHFDHTGKAEELRKKYQIPVYIGSGDREMLEDPATFACGRVSAKVEEYSLFEDGEIFNVGEMQIKAIATPGHSKGGMCFHCEDHLFTGDTIFRQNIGRTDFYGGDYQTLLQSLQKLEKLDCAIHSGHGEPSTMEFERAYNPYFPKEIKG